MAQRAEEEKVEIKPLMEGSFPCQIPYSITRDLYVNKLSYFLMLGLPLLATVGIFFCAPWAAVIPFGIFLLLALLCLVALISSQRRFAKGTILPGIVFNTESNFIATLVDLSNGETLPIHAGMGPRPWLCVKIFQAQVDAILGSDFRAGARVPVIATFKPVEGKWLHHADIDPELLGEGTWNQEVIKAAMDAIPSESWAALEQAIREIPPNAGIDQVFLVRSSLRPYETVDGRLGLISRYVLRALKQSHLFVVDPQNPSMDNGPAMQIARYVIGIAGFDPNHANYTIASWRHSEGMGGFTITNAGFGQAGASPSFFASWENLHDAMLHGQTFEFLMKDGTRYRVDNSKFPGLGLRALEPTIDFMRDPLISLKLVMTPDN